MRALWSDGPNCSHNVSQKVKRIRRVSENYCRCSDLLSVVFLVQRGPWVCYESGTQQKAVQMNFHIFGGFSGVPLPPLRRQVVLALTGLKKRITAETPPPGSRG